MTGRGRTRGVWAPKSEERIADRLGVRLDSMRKMLARAQPTEGEC